MVERGDASAKVIHLFFVIIISMVKPPSFSVADLHQDPAFLFDEDPYPDPNFHFDADPDHAFHFDADPDADPDPDPTTHFSSDLDPPMLQNDFHLFTLMRIWIRILLFTLMQIRMRIQLSSLMKIRIRNTAKFTGSFVIHLFNDLLYVGHSDVGEKNVSCDV